MYFVEVNGNNIVVIDVPRADRSYRPVYIDGNPLNTYRRNGEGDYKCTKEEYQAMVRDASVKTQDMLVNADYYGRRGVVIIKRHDEITLSNPGNMRIEKETAVCGGISDPRNSTMLKMFNFIDIGERAGSGIPNIFHVWKEENRNAPVILEEFDPDRVTLVLPLTPQKIGDKKSAIKIGDKKSVICERAKNSIIQYLTDNPEGKTGEMPSMTAV